MPAPAVHPHLLRPKICRVRRHHGLILSQALCAHGVSAWKALHLLLDCMNYATGNIRPHTPLCQQPWPWLQRPRQIWRCAQLLSGPAPSPGPCTPVWPSICLSYIHTSLPHISHSFPRNPHVSFGPLLHSAHKAQQRGPKFSKGAGRHLRSACSAREASCAVRVPDVPGRGGSPSLLDMRCSCAASSSSAADRQRLKAYSHHQSQFASSQMVTRSTAKSRSDGIAQ